MTEIPPIAENDSRPRHWNWKPKLRWFAAEIAVVVVGVLIALALNAWWQAQQAAAGEENYLVLISRDLGQMEANLDELLAFEKRQLQDGLTAYRFLSLPDRSSEQKEAISRSLTVLASRRTMNLTNATYEDLISTGNLQLIRNLELRSQIVEFYEEAERDIEIHNKNNTFFVDDMFVTGVFGSGLFFQGLETNLQIVNQADSLLIRSALESGYAGEPGRFWSLPTTSAEWAQVKGLLRLRIGITAGADFRAEKLLEQVRELKEAVDAELER